MSISLNSAEQLRQSLASQTLAVASTVSESTKLLSVYAFYSLQETIINQINSAIGHFRSYLNNLLKIVDAYKQLKHNLYFQMQDKLHLTKDKIDLYKEYLDVLSKQFTVQDGRSLEYVNVIITFTSSISNTSLINSILTKVFRRTNKNNNPSLDWKLVDSF